MRLFLSSFRLSEAPQELSGLIGPGAQTAVVLNALDNVPALPRADWMAEEKRSLAALGLPASELDLRQYYAEPAALREALAEVALVWATGGNAFVLRDSLRRSGLDTLLAERLTENSIAYGGYSAGACVTGPTLRGIELVDDVNAVRRPIWDGLGLVDFSLAPHYRSAHREAESIEHVVAYFQAHGLPYRTLRDGQAIVARDGALRVVGRHV